MATPEQSIQSMIELFKKCEVKSDLSEFLAKYPDSYKTDKHVCGAEIWSTIKDACSSIEEAAKSVSSKYDGDGDELATQKSAIISDLEKVWKDGFEPVRKALEGAAGKGQDLESCYVFVPQAAWALSETGAKIKQAKAMSDSEFGEEFSTIAEAIEQSFTSVADFMQDLMNEEIDTQYE